MIQLNPKGSQRVYELKQEEKTTPQRATACVKALWQAEEGWQVAGGRGAG